VVRQPFDKLRIVLGAAIELQNAGDIFLFTTLNHLLPPDAPNGGSVE
jgi:hypothetical protein